MYVYMIKIIPFLAFKKKMAKHRTNIIYSSLTKTSMVRKKNKMGFFFFLADALPVVKTYFCEPFTSADRHLHSTYADCSLLSENSE